MNTYVTGSAIRQLRETKHLTQAELAGKLAVSAKAISKWETAKGLPDIALLEPLAAALGVSVLELMQGEPVVNRNRAPDFRSATRRTAPQKIHLREPDEADREQVMAYREEFLALGSRMDGTSALDQYADFDAWLAAIRNLKDPATTPAGLVPATQYLALDEQEQLVGMTNLRHHLNDYLLAYGGHIGYSVLPSQRQNGYATQMLHLTLEKAKERGIAKVRICCDRYNAASAKTIRANGGVLEDELFDSSDGTLTQRYWIENQ